MRFRLSPLLVTGLLITRALAQVETAPPAKDEFSSLVKLAPFVVNGQSLKVSIYARTNSDRRYGEQFAEEVVRVVYEAVTENTGKGLAIIGAKGEPHPIFVFRKFLALAKDGKLDPAIAAHAPELTAMMDRWEHMLNHDDQSSGDKKDDDVDLDFEKIMTALPLPLEGIGAKLYQLAWEEKFDEAKVEAKLRALHAGDLERRELFKSFDWVFYLPPKGVLDKVLDDVIAEALKKEDKGFFFRMAVKTLMVVVKPKIRRVIEAMRQGMMLTTVVQAQTHFTEAQVSALTGAYIEAYMPFESETKPPGNNDHERAVNAVRAQLQKIEAKAKTAEAMPSAPTEHTLPDSVH